MADDLAWETLATDIAYSCPGFDIVHEDVVLPDGTETDFDFLREGDSVVVLPMTAEGEVVVIEEWRQAVKRVNRALPAGSMEASDDEPRAAVDRDGHDVVVYEADWRSGLVIHRVVAEHEIGASGKVARVFLPVVHTRLAQHGRYGQFGTGPLALDARHDSRPRLGRHDVAPVAARPLILFLRHP